MEAKLLQESQSMLKKMFKENDTGNTGSVSATLIPKMLESLHLEIDIKAEEIKAQIAKVDPEETGLLDYEAYSKVILYFLVKESRNDSDSFADKREISLGFFPTA